MKRSFVKRLFASLLVLVLLLSLAACASKPTAPESDRPGDTLLPASEPAGREINDAPGDPEAPADDGGEFFYEPGLSADAEFGAFYEEGKAAAPGSAPAAAPEEGEADDPVVIDDPVPPDEPIQSAEGLKLTAAEWNDNQNWPFFTNLVNAGTISFPSFGLDPRNRLELLVTDAAKAPLANETVTLLDAEGQALWTARTDRNGTAYLFWDEGQTPARVRCGEASAEVQAPTPSEDPQGKPVMKPLESLTLELSLAAPAQTGLQVLFIVDTTGSMTDEIAYLQKDFSAIAERVGSDGVRWAVSFYRDEGDDYVTRHSEFTSDVAEVQRKINAEYADGGGDTPEAVAQVLTECLTDRSDWDENCAKLAFLIFDAPPHEGTDAALRAAVKAAAEKGIKLIPVVASNAERDTELFGRALAILTNGTYVFLTDDSGVGDSHLEPIVGDYEVELLQDLIVRLILAEKPV